MEPTKIYEPLRNTYESKLKVLIDLGIRNTIFVSDEPLWRKHHKTS